MQQHGHPHYPTVHGGGDISTVQQLVERVIRDDAAQLAQHRLVSGALAKQAGVGQAGCHDSQQCGHHDTDIVGEFDHREDGRQRCVQDRAHGRRHADGDVQRIIRGDLRMQGVGDDADRAAEAGADQQAGSDQANRQAEAAAHGGGQGLAQADQQQGAEHHLGIDDQVHAVITQAQGFRHQQRQQAGEAARQGEAHDNRPAGQPRCQLQYLDKTGYDHAAAQAQQQYIGQLQQGVELHGGNAQQGSPGNQAATHRGRRYRCQHDRDEARHRVLGDDHFHGEYHPRQGGVEGGGYAAGGAAGNENAQAVIG